MATIDEKSGAVFKSAFEFSRIMREKMIQEKRNERLNKTGGVDGSVDAMELRDPCSELMGLLSHFLGWGGDRTNEYRLSLGGVERDDDASYFYMGFSITRPEEPNYGYGGCIMFRDREWSAHS